MTKKTKSKKRFHVVTPEGAERLFGFYASERTAQAAFAKKYPADYRGLCGGPFEVINERIIREVDAQEAKRQAKLEAQAASEQPGRANARYGTIGLPNGDIWNGEDTCALAGMIYRRWGRDLNSAAAAYRRLMQNSCTDDQFAEMLQIIGML